MFVVDKQCHNQDRKALWVHFKFIFKSDTENPKNYFDVLD